MINRYEVVYSPKALEDLRNLQVQDVGRRHDHRHTEVRALHEGGAKCQNQDAEQVGKFCVKRFFIFHESTS